LEQASAAKSQFLANVSHELRTPLNAILGYAAMTLQGVTGELSAPQRRHLSRIDANARQLLTLINEILDITRIEAGRMPIQVVPFSPPDLLSEVITELEPIIVNPAGNEATRGSAMRSDHRGQQIVVNLLSNALFAEGGRGVDGRRTGHGDRGGRYGHDRTRLSENLRDFARWTARRAARYGGTGRDLSICRRLASMLRGR
jgi:signal transduction histidine kinase